jgi:hypothetical protein
LLSPNILDFSTEIVIISGFAYWIPAQHIHVGMFQTWSMQYLEIEVLQHVDPMTSPSVCI